MDTITPDAVVSIVPLHKGNDGSGNASGTNTVASTEKGGVEPSTTKGRKLLTCNEIQKLDIVRQIGKGVKNIVFEVKLPGSPRQRRSIAWPRVKVGVAEG